MQMATQLELFITKPQPGGTAFRFSFSTSYWGQVHHALIKLRLKYDFGWKKNGFFQDLMMLFKLSFLCIQS